MLVVYDHEERRVANFRISPDGLERSLDQRFAFFHVMIRVLVAGGEGGLPIAARRICKPGLDETVRGKIVILTGRKKVIHVGAKEIALSRKPVKRGGHRRIVIVNYRVELIFRQALINRRGQVSPIDSHVDPPDRRCSVHERSVWKSRPWHRGKPAVAHAKLLSEPSQYWQGPRRKAFHNPVRIAGIPSLPLVTSDEAVHRWLVHHRCRWVAVELSQRIETRVPGIRREISRIARIA